MVYLMKDRYSVLIIAIIYLCGVYSAPLSEESYSNPLQIKPATVDLKTTLMDIEIDAVKNIDTDSAKSRPKRQGAGKYAEAAKMSQLKLLQVYLQMFRNLVDTSYVGGTHPFHPNVPRAFVELYKRRIGEVLFPDVGEDVRTANR